MIRLYDLTENWSIVMKPGNMPPVDIYLFLHLIPESVFGNWHTGALTPQTSAMRCNKLYADTLNKVDNLRKHNNIGLLHGQGS
jgi:hypothetical protein